MGRPDDRMELCPGPKELGIAHSAPLLADIRFAVTSSMTDAHEQLATLAPLAHLNTIVLDFIDFFEKDLCPDTLLSLPPGVTKLILCSFDRCVPAVARPEYVATVHEESLHDQIND